MKRREFDRLTIEELVELERVWWEREKRQDFRAAQICVVLAMAHRAKPGDRYTPSDFFPSLHVEREPMSDEAMEAKLTAVFGG